MVGEIINCKTCNKVFKKQLSHNCPACHEKEQQQFQNLFRKLQESRSSGGVLIDELSKTLEIPATQIEEWYFESKLGTAGQFLLFRCKQCGCEMKSIQRRGRYCTDCSFNLSDEAGVEVKSQNQINKERQKEAEQAEQQQQLKKKQNYADLLSANSNRERRGFGFIR